MESKINFILPEDYKASLLVSNGLEGTIGDYYLALWSINGIMLSNLISEGRLVIGSDGGNTKYVLQSNGNLFLYMKEHSIWDYYKVLGATFFEFIKCFIVK